ncbi:DNA polymerase eta isoform X3 [Olea europaea var. sylvestris]|uniref:DNA polymerase eta isoform X3 n=1 Tax=Olea europaea var. sylvestris TaxID=158386 RepID=UPI000C1D3F80|nr:DNA polymerase eta isoform X3 [Olea europaea var. sylvestris]
MPVSRAQSSDSRIIAHVDMDCFYVQVEQRKQPTLRGQPTAVVQYNSWKGGGLIAVSYEARMFGVKRSMRGSEAKEVCPEIQLVQVPVARGKADLSVYRNAGSEVVSILSRKGRCERASIDEVYLDLTESAETMLAELPPHRLESINEEALKSHVLGLDVQDGDNARESVRKWFLKSDADHRDKLLACGALIVSELRLQVLEETEFTCSAGIAHNKMLAKLASGMNKPAQQTVVPFLSVNKLLEPLPIKKMKQLGGKLGTSLQVDLGVNTVGDLLHFSEQKLQEHYGINTGTWLWNAARGISGDEVESRLLPKSHGSGKTFPGPRALKTSASVQKWLNELCEELSERLLSDLEQNKRIAHTLSLHLNDSESVKKFPSKSCPIRYGTAKIQEDAFNLFHAGLREYVGSRTIKTKGNLHHGWAITGLSISASKIVEIPSVTFILHCISVCFGNAIGQGTRSISKYFDNQVKTCTSEKQSIDLFTQYDADVSYSGNGSYLRFHSMCPQMKNCEEDTGNKHFMPIVNQDKDQNESKDESFIPKSIDEQHSSFSTVRQQQDGVTRDILSLSSSGAELNQKETKIDFLGEETEHGLKSKEQKWKPYKEKGTILRYFGSHGSCSLPKEDHDKILGDNKASSSSDSKVMVDSFFEVVEGKLPPKNLVPRTSTTLSGQDELRRTAWSYKSDEIDQITLNELPIEIQAEVRTWLRPHKRANTMKKGSSILDYFLPTRNS